MVPLVQRLTVVGLAVGLALVGVVPSASAVHECDGIIVPSTSLCVRTEPFRKLGDVVVPRLEGGTELVREQVMTDTFGLIRIDAAGTFVEFRGALAKTTSSPDYEDQDLGVAQITFSDFTFRDRCAEGDDRYCHVLVREQSPSSDTGILVGELWEDRLIIVDSHQLIANVPLLVVKNVAESGTQVPPPLSPLP